MRLALDWDSAEAVAENLPDVKEQARIGTDTNVWELYRSANGTGAWPPDGAHFVLYDLGASVRGQLRLREKYGDDDRRLTLDRNRWDNDSPHLNILFSRKYVDRSETPRSLDESGPTWRSGKPAVQIDGMIDIPEAERIRQPDGSIDYAKLANLLVENYDFGSFAGLWRQILDRDSVSITTEARKRAYDVRKERRPISRGERKALLDYARRRNIGHYVDGKAVPQNRVKPANWTRDKVRRRAMIEYIDVKWSDDGASPNDDDYGFRELNIQTSTVNDNIDNHVLKYTHDDAVQEALDRLNPTSPINGQTLEHNRKLAPDAEASEPSAVIEHHERREDFNWSDSWVDADEWDAYRRNLPTAVTKPARRSMPPEEIQDRADTFAIFEVTLYGPEGLGDSPEWHVIGIDDADGRGLNGATILKDNRGWW